MSGLHDDFPPHAQAREEAMLREKAAARAELRDRFAGYALIGMMASRDPNSPRFHPEDDAAYVYAVADAMMNARPNICNND
jgi:hypothetical protein